MRIKGFQDEDFVNYKEPCMYICTPHCSFKCDKEAGGSYCHNSSLANSMEYEFSDDEMIKRYCANPITKAICIAGLEPFDSWGELQHFFRSLRQRYNCMDTVVIYTGYNKDEIEQKIEILKPFKNIIIKYGRFIPNQRKHFDEVLGVYLASPNQYAERIS